MPEDSDTTLLVSDGWDGKHEVRAGPGRHPQVRIDVCSDADVQRCDEMPHLWTGGENA